MTNKELRRLREERDRWFTQARLCAHSLRSTIERAEQADKEYQTALEALKEQPAKKNKRSNRITNIV